MPLSSRRRNAAVAGLEAWPGYVDALSTLLMVIIFVLLVFVLAQFFLSFALSGRSKALDQVKGQLADMVHMLALEQGKENTLQQSLNQVTAQLAVTQKDRQSVSDQLASVQKQLQGALVTQEQYVELIMRAVDSSMMWEAESEGMLHVMLAAALEDGE